MKTNLYYILPFLLIFLSCSSLKVEVAVANRGLVENYANGKKNKILIEALEDRNLSFYQNYYTDFIKIYTDRNIEVGDGIKKQLRERISETYTDNLQQLVNAKEFLNKGDLINFNKAVINIQKNMEGVKERVEEFDKTITNYNEDSITKNQLDKVNEKNIESLNSAITQRDRFSILGDVNNSFITDKNEQKNLWNSVFNNNVVKTHFGHSDIAILLRNTASKNSEVRSGDYNNNFTIKAVRLDDTDMMKAASDVMRQAVNIFAAASTGFVGNVKTVDNSGATQVTREIDSVTELDDYKDEQEKSEKQKYKYLKLKEIIIREINLDKITKMNENDFKTEITRLKHIYQELIK